MPSSPTLDEIDVKLGSLRIKRENVDKTVDSPLGIDGIYYT